jgi:hypothetical protein
MISQDMRPHQRYRLEPRVGVVTPQTSRDDVVDDILDDDDVDIVVINRVNSQKRRKKYELRLQKSDREEQRRQKAKVKENDEDVPPTQIVLSGNDEDDDTRTIKDCILQLRATNYGSKLLLHPQDNLRREKVFVYDRCLPASPEYFPNRRKNQ